MADYYTNFSLILALSQKQQEYAISLVQAIKAYSEEGRPLPSDFPESLRQDTDNWTFDVESVSKGLWIHSQDSVGAVCEFIQHLLQKFHFSPYVAFSWSTDCSKPRTDAFGGGAAFITCTEIKSFNTSEWLRNQIVNGGFGV